LRAVEPPDDEWRSLLRRIDQEVGTLAVATGHSKHPEFAEQRPAIRREFLALVSRRMKFWR
jgi:hypothetical protein